MCCQQNTWQRLFGGDSALLFFLYVLVKIESGQIMAYNSSQRLNRRTVFSNVKKLQIISSMTQILTVASLTRLLIITCFQL